MFRLVKGLKTDGKEVEGVICVRVSDEKLCFREKERGKVWKDYMKRSQMKKMTGIIMWKEMQWKVQQYV